MARIVQLYDKQRPEILSADHKVGAQPIITVTHPRMTPSIVNLDKLTDVYLAQHSELRNGGAKPRMEVALRFAQHRPCIHRPAPLVTSMIPCKPLGHREADGQQCAYDQ
jgi:hypothetical protein